jgi:phenylpropionate dioxygenase-like ring-hydroxylating dioxygenase large terminal subunit/AcrR family transcriptional regulator
MSEPAVGERQLHTGRRLELIEATISSIAERGLSGTTVAKVAETAGLSQGIVNFYFKSKDALLLSTLTYVSEGFEHRWREALAQVDSDPIHRLEALIDSNFDDTVCNTRWVAVSNAFWGESRARKDYMRVCGSRDAAYLDQIRSLMREIVQQGDHGRIDDEAVALALFHLLSSLPESLLDPTKLFDRDEARETCRNFLMSIFPDEFPKLARSLRDDQPAFRRGPADLKQVPSPAAFPTLPAWVYGDEEFVELEKEVAFRRQWLLVGHVSEIPDRGDYMTLDAADERALVIRDGDGRLRAFHNVCRHRASRVVRSETGHCERSIVCPYHGWTYGFDGRLHAVPSDRTFPGLDKSEFSLPEIDLDEWMGFVFVRFRGSGTRVSDLLRPLEEEIRPYRLPEMKPYGERWSETLDVNWKCVVENDAEGYHIAQGHPGLRRLFGESYRDDSRGHRIPRSFAVLRDEPSPVWSERMYQKFLPEADHLPEGHRRAWLYYGLFPGITFAIAPDQVAYYQILPLAPHRTRLHGHAFALEDDRREMRAARYLCARLNRRVAKQDRDFCTWTDGGLRSSSYSGGPLSQLESGVGEFQDRIRDLIPVARCAVPPVRGRVAEENRRLRAGGALGRVKPETLDRSEPTAIPVSSLAMDEPETLTSEGDQ